MHVAKCISKSDFISSKKNPTNPRWQIYSPNNLDGEY